MSHDNFMDYGLGPFGNNPHQGCGSDLYGNCTQPLGPDFNVQLKRGSCAEVLPFNKMQQSIMLASMNPPTKSRGGFKDEIIHYSKPYYAGIL